MRILHVVVSDLHSNSTSGLVAGAFQRRVGGVWKPTAGQRWLWAAWLDFWNVRIRGLREQHRPDQFWITLAGDVTDGDHHETTQIITRDPAEQLELAVEVLAPAIEEADHVFVATGTPTHVGNAGWMEERIAHDIGATKPYARLPGYSALKLRLNCAGVKFNIAHKWSMGTMPHTRPNSANKLAFFAQAIAIERRTHVPDVIIRAHQHRWADSGRNYATLAIQLPCWQLPTEYVLGKGQAEEFPHIGGVWFLCEEGNYVWDRLMYAPPAEPYLTP